MFSFVSAFDLRYNCDRTSIVAIVHGSHVVAPKGMGVVHIYMCIHPDCLVVVLLVEAPTVRGDDVWYVVLPCLLKTFCGDARGVQRQVRE